MDMLNLKSKFMVGIVESVLKKQLSKALGTDVDICIESISATVNEDGKLELTVPNVKMETDAKIIKKLMGL